MRPTATADAVARAGRWAALALAACLCIGAAAADLARGGSERLALVEETTGGQDVLVIEVSRGTVMRLARGLTEIDRLVWSPDGSRQREVGRQRRDLRRANRRVGAATAGRRPQPVVVTRRDADRVRRPAERR